MVWLKLGMVRDWVGPASQEKIQSIPGHVTQHHPVLLQQPSQKMW